MNNSADNPNLFDREVHPYLQCGVAIAGIFVLLFLHYLPHWMGIIQLEQHQPWTISAAMLLLFGVFNSVLSLGAKDVNKYWNRSIFAFIALFVGGGAIAWGLSGLSITEAKSFKWIYIVFTFGYLLFLSIVSLARLVVSLAQRTDKKLRGEADD